VYDDHDQVRTYDARRPKLGSFSDWWDSLGMTLAPSPAHPERQRETKSSSPAHVKSQDRDV
jgi:hypothetical protein